MKTVAVLFARADSIYKQLEATDVWDAERNALDWPGGAPIVAHPPCRAWCVLKAFAKPLPGEKELAPWAVAQVRRWGGVLEHPFGSELWPFCKLPPAKGLPDAFGGWTLLVDQFHFGHQARKRTLLYIVGCPPKQLPTRPYRSGKPTHLVTTSRTKGKKSLPKLSKAAREKTPPAFASWLCKLARLCQPPRIRIEL